MAKKTAARRPDEYIGEQVRLARRSKGWKQSDLADRLAELGYNGWRQSKVAKIESGEMKRPSLDDVLALAVALGVKPAHLMTPTFGDVELTSQLRFDGSKFKQWLSGNEPLLAEDHRTYHAGVLVPEEEYRLFVRTSNLVRRDTGEPLTAEELEMWVQSQLPARDADG